MRSGSPTVRVLAAALLAVVVSAAGCGRPPDEAWLRFLGFKSGDTTLTVLEGDLNDGTTDSADAVFSNASVIVGAADSGAGTGILVTNAHLDYKMSGFSPPAEDYPLNLYLPASSHTNGTAGTGGATEARTSLPLATASLKQWLVNANAAGSAPTVRLTADATFFAETDEGTDLEVHGSVAIVLSASGSDGSANTVSVAATTATATTAVPGRFTVTRTGGTAEAITVDYTVLGTAEPGTDYTELDGYVVIPAKSASASIPVNVLTGAASGRTVIVSLEESTAYTVGGGSKATVTIAN